MEDGIFSQCWLNVFLVMISFDFNNSPAAHQASYTIILEYYLELMAVMLAAPIRMHDEAFIWSPSEPRHAQGINHKLPRHPWLD